MDKDSKLCHSFRLLLVMLAHKLKQRLVDLFSVSFGKEVMSTLYEFQLGVWRARKVLHLFLRIGNGEYGIISSLS